MEHLIKLKDWDSLERVRRRYKRHAFGGRALCSVHAIGKRRAREGDVAGTDRG